MGAEGIQRIHIVGGPASGKSTLSRKLAAETGFPIVELDKIFWDDESPIYAHRRDSAKRDCLLEAHIQGEAWIVEGVYWSWCLESFKKADKIILLNTPLRVRQWRLFIRFIKRKLGFEKSIEKNNLIKGYVNTARWNFSWDHDNLPKIMAVLAEFDFKTEYK